MRWNDREKKEYPWKRWFAWKPTRLDGKGNCVWLEFIERRLTYDGRYYIMEHRYIEQATDVKGK